MTEEKPTKEDIESWLNCEPYVAENYLFGPEWNEKIRESIRALISQPPAPKVVTREQVDELVYALAEDDLEEGIDRVIVFLADLGFEVKEKKP
jgi:hypothetical protein